MAAQKTSDLVRFFEIVMEGKPRQVRAFLAGLLLGTGDDQPVWFNYDVGILHEGFAAKLAESAHLRPADTRFVTTLPLRDLLRRHEKRILAESGLRLVSTRVIRGARLPFRYQAFGRVYGDQIKTLLGSLPAGVSLKNHRCEEKVRPEAAGIEGYAPAHDYELCGEGAVTGPIDLVLQARDRLLEQPLIQLKKIELTLA